jgi:hypothetical protein
MLPFTREQFIAVFADYNVAIWPAQIVAYALGLALVAALLRPTPVGRRFISAVLAVMWAWTGIVYHGMFFTAINRAAALFGTLFVLQALLFVHVGVMQGRLAFGRPAGPGGALGWALLVYAGVLYPLLGAWSGHAYPELPTFGIAPCPVTLFTIGLLLLTTAPVPRRLLAIPLAWSLIGGSAAWLLGIAQDWPLLFSGAAIVWLAWRDRQPQVPALR